MADDPIGPMRFSLRRWSQRKLDAARDGSGSQRPPESETDVGPAPPEPARAPIADARATLGSPPATSGIPQALARDAWADSPVAEPALPPPESLTFDSDFTPFMQPGVDADVRRTAVRKLLRDPRFNVMDGLDVYIDDYSIESPIEPELVRTLMQARYIFNPPQTRVNEQGFVEDVPPSPVQSGDAATRAAQANESAGTAVPIEHPDVGPSTGPAEAIPVERTEVVQSAEPAAAALSGAASAGTENPGTVVR